MAILTLKLMSPDKGEVHAAYTDSDRTLCGKDTSNWTLGVGSLLHVSCKRCKRSIRARERKGHIVQSVVY